MNSLGFSLSPDDDDESQIESIAEQSLRQQYDRSTSRQSSVLSSDTAAEEMSPPKIRETLSNQLSETSMSTPHRLHPTPPQLSETSSSTRRKRSRAATQHSAFAPPPVETKGAYDLAGSGEDALERSLETLGITHPTDKNAIIAVAKRAQQRSEGIIVEEPGSFKSVWARDCEEMYGKDSCAICEESTPYTNEIAKRRQTSSAKMQQENMSAIKRKKEARRLAAQATFDLNDGEMRCHDVIHKLETQLRVMIADNRIFKLLLVLHRVLIEQYMEFYGIPYVPWTLDMLEVHYDPDQKHFYQPLRQAKATLDMSTTQMTRAYEATYTGGSYDFRGFKAYKEMHECVLKDQARVDNYLATSQANVSEALRILASAIFRNTGNENTARLGRDPETAAGRLIAGGDNFTTAGKSATHEANSEYARFHISAQ